MRYLSIRSQTVLRHGFTVLELVIALVVLSLVAVLVLSQAADLRERAYIATMQSDLHHAIAKEAEHRNATGDYAANPLDIPTYRLSPDVELLGGRVDTVADGVRLTLVLKHAKTPAICGVMMSEESQVTTAIVCDPRPRLPIGASQLTPPRPGDLVTFDASPALAELAFAPHLVGQLVGQSPSAGRDIQVVAWDFGDGTRVAGPPEEFMVVTHRFAPAADPNATYTVRLAVVRGDRTVKGALTNATIQIAPTLQNEPPVAVLRAAPNPVPPSVPVNFDGTASSDPEGALVGYAWQFSDGSDASGVRVTRTFPSAGVQTARLIVMDHRGLADTATATLLVDAVPIARAMVTPNPLVVGRVLTLDGSASSDPDGHALDALWAVGSATLTGTTVSYTPTAPATLPWRLVVRDPLGLADTVDGTVDVVENQPPIAQFTAVPESLYVGGQVQLDASSSTDADGTIVRRSWAASDGWSENGAVVLYTFTTRDPVTFTLTVEDDLGALGTAQRTLTTTNRDPIADFSFAPTAPTSQQTVTFTALASDPDGDPLWYAWDFGDGAFATGVTASHAYLAPGTYAATLTVTDDRNGRATVARTLGIANQAPMASFTSSTTTPLTSDPVTFTSTSTDPDGIVAGYQWLLDGEPATSATEGTFTTTWPTPSTHTVALQVTDDQGQPTTSAPATITVRNRAPTAPAISCVPTSGTGNTNITCSVQTASTDPDGGTIAYAWWASGVNYGSGASVANVFSPGTYSVTAVASDGQGGTATSNAVVLTISYPAPTASFTVSNSNPIVSDVVTFNASASTANGGTITSYAWNFGDGATGSGVTATHAYSTAASRTVTLTITTNDGRQAQTQRTVTVVGASAPSGSISCPNPTGINATTTCTSTVTAGSGSVTSYSWNSTGATFGSPAAANTTARWSTIGTKTVTLRVTNSYGVFRDFTTTVTVPNQNPTATISYAPTPVYTNASTNFTSNASDPDGGTLSYSWSFGSGASPATSTAANPTGVRWSTTGTKTVTLTVSDGQGGSVTRTASVSVTAPPSFTATVSCPSVVTPNYTLRWTASAANGTPASYSFRYWYSDNGTTYFGPYTNGVANGNEYRLWVGNDIMLRRYYRIEVTIRSTTGATDTDQATAYYSGGSVGTCTRP